MNEKLPITKNDEDDLSLRRPKTTTENFLLFFVVFGIVLSIGGFWNVLSILWNRVKYTTGSLWGNYQPIYYDWDLNLLRQQLIKDYLIYFSGVIILLVVSGFLIYYLIIKRKWEEKTKLLTIFGTFFSGFMIITSFWINQSISVISNLDSMDSESQGGFDWIRVDLAEISKFIEISTLIFSIIFFLILLITLAVLVKNRNSKKNKQSEVHQNIFVIFMKNVPFYGILIIYLIFTLLPVYIVIQVSLSTYTEIQSGNIPGSPLNSLILNYSSVMFSVSTDESGFSTAFLNSLSIGLGTGILGLTVSVSTAYSLARFKFKSNKFLTFLILSTQMFPGIILLLPQFIIWARLDLLDKLGGLLLASAAGSTAYCTWMMKGYFETIPIEIEEAATIDGLNRFGNFTKIAFPLAKSGLVAVLIFTFLTSWQDFILARTFLRTVGNYTLPLLADNYENSATYDAQPFFELLAPYSILVALPVVVFFMLMQKQLASGAVAGSVK